MNFTHTTLIGFSLFLYSIFACNLPGNAQPLSVNDLAATAIAATLMEQARDSGLWIFKYTGP